MYAAVMPRRTLKVGRTVSIKIPDELGAKLQEFVSQGGYLSVGEALKVLLVRGLYLDQKPGGRLSEPAFLAAYISAKGALFDVVFRSLGRLLTKALDEAFQELMARQGKTAL
jgi:hypothetical protein